MQRAKNPARARLRSARIRNLSMPRTVRPMLAVLAADLPRQPGRWSFEYKWDGVRAIGYIKRDTIQLRSRNDLEITPRYPELNTLPRAMSVRNAIVDGEIVALDAAGRTSFPLLQRRMHVKSADEVQRLARQINIFYVLFDLLWLDGEDLMPRPYLERRKLLEELAVAGRSWGRTPAGHEGALMLRSARENGMEGVVAKKLESVYEPGRRSNCWLKIKIVARQELVIAGWLPELGNNRHRVGALLTGYYDPDGTLHYAGRVGTGFTADTHARLVRAFAKHERPTSPFSERLPGRGHIWLDPTLVGEFEYRRWAEGGLMQQGAFKGLRADKRARDVIRETLSSLAAEKS